MIVGTIGKIKRKIIYADVQWRAAHGYRFRCRTECRWRTENRRRSWARERAEKGNSGTERLTKWRSFIECNCANGRANLCCSRWLSLVCRLSTHATTANRLNINKRKWLSERVFCVGLPLPLIFRSTLGYVADSQRSTAAQHTHTQNAFLTFRD